MTWSLFDWGKRKGVVGEREAQLSQARENVRRVTDRLSVDVAKAWRKVERSRMMVEVAREALQLRRESERISGDQLRAGVISAAKNAEALAATRSAEADELQASLAYGLALAEIDSIAGTARPAASAVSQSSAMRANVIRSYGFFSPRSYSNPTVLPSTMTRFE
jgi:outer membrane protein TolC